MTMFAMELVRSVLAGELSLALVTAPPEDAQIAATPFAQAPLYAALLETHPAIHNERLMLSDLARDNWPLRCIPTVEKSRQRSLRDSECHAGRNYVAHTPSPSVLSGCAFGHDDRPSQPTQRLQLRTPVRLRGGDVRRGLTVWQLRTGTGAMELGPPEITPPDATLC